MERLRNIFRFVVLTSVHWGLLSYCNIATAQNSSSNVLYGMAMTGGSAGQGTIFVWDMLAKTLKADYDFSNTKLGINPSGSFVETNGILFGMTKMGGQFDKGVLFSFNPVTKKYIVEKDFDGNNGAYPEGNGLVLGLDGKLYGLTIAGGPANAGVLFSFDTGAHTLTVLKGFTGPDGRGPVDRLFQASNGKLYGVTTYGGNLDYGLIFSFDPATLVYTIEKSMEANEGPYPHPGLIQATDGILYGTTSGPPSFGNIYSFNINTKVYSIEQSLRVGDPRSTLLQAKDGKLYGMGTNEGYLEPTIFSFDLTNKSFVPYRYIFNGPYPGLTGNAMQASDGLLYNVLSKGGFNDNGRIFYFDPATNTTKYEYFNGQNGSSPYCRLLEIKAHQPLGIECPKDTVVGNTANQCTVSIEYAVAITGDTSAAFYHEFTGATKGIGNGTGTGSNFNPGITDVTIRASSQGQTAICNFKITVNGEKLAPVIIHQAAVNFCARPDSTYSLLPVSVTDNCQVKDITYTISGSTARTGAGSDASGFFNNGTSTISWMAIDSSGNISTANTVVYVADSFSVHIADQFAVQPGGQVNTLYKGYGPSTLTLKPFITGNETNAGQYSFLWSTGDTQEQLVVASAVAGKFSYSLIVTDSNRCISRAEKEVIIQDIRCGNDLRKVQLCTSSSGQQQEPKDICASRESVATLLENGATLGICNPDIPPPLQTSNILVNPNPNHGNFNLQVRNMKGFQLHIRIMNQCGSVLSQRELYQPDREIQSMEFKLGNLPKGVYFIQVISSNGIAANKFIIQ